ncbi:MAG: hypothetical protein ACOY3I_02045 [Verrucomicrobiota bacterium]
MLNLRNARSVLAGLGLLMMASWVSADELKPKPKTETKDTPKVESESKVISSKRGKISESKSPNKINPKSEDAVAKTEVKEAPKEKPVISKKKETQVVKEEKKSGLKKEEKTEVAEKKMESAPTPPRGEWDLPFKIDESFSIAKIYTFINDPKKIKTSKNQALNFERKYFNYGAVTQEQKKNKMGYYYIVSWKNHGPATDLILRFDYRQAKTKDLVHTLEIPYTQVEGFHKATFSISGDAYERFGPVKSWRVSVVRNGAIVAKEQSYIW